LLPPLPLLLPPLPLPLLLLHHRALVRHLRSQGLPDPPATPSQLARIEELKLQLHPDVQAALTAPTARALLYRAALTVEDAQQSQRGAPNRAAARR
jgi:hypothetical protein